MGELMREGDLVGDVGEERPGLGLKGVPGGRRVDDRANVLERVGPELLGEEPDHRRDLAKDADVALAVGDRDI